MTIATITVTGSAEGETAIEPVVTAVGDESGYEYFVASVEAATLNVEAESTPPLAVGDNTASDVDGDGAYEDVDGDGEVTVVDVQLLYESRDANMIEENPDAVDFNSDGTFDIVDVQALFDFMLSTGN